MKFIKVLLKYFRLIILSEFREKQLAKYISQEIKKLHRNNQEIRILDFGSGMNPVVIQKIYENIKSDYKDVNFHVDCFDFYSQKQISELKDKFNSFNFFNLPDFDSSNKKYDYAIILDVLHHVGIDHNRKEVVEIFLKVSNVANYVIIKDHFYTNQISKYILIAMDFVGNYYNNVSIPSTYFTEKIYEDILKLCKLTEIKRLRNCYFYKKYWLFFANPKLHFISIISKRN
jgi:hypothetical protein